MNTVSGRIPLLMKILPALLTMLLCLTAASGVKAEDTPLELSMGQIKKAYKQLSTDLAKPQDSQKDAYLALATTIRSEAVKGRDLVPEKAGDLPAEQKAAMIKSYQESMDDFIGSIDSLIQSIQANKWDDAKAAIATMKTDMKDGHREFRRKE